MSSTPILFFPGTMGSRLYFPNSRRYWDPDSTRRMLRWAPIRPFRTDDDNRKQLHFTEPAGVIAEAVQGEAESLELGWGGLVWSFYSDYILLLRRLATDGQAFAIGYDWRQDLRSLGEYAAEKIRLALRTTRAPKVKLVGHSMGGLVIRAALKADPNLVGAIDRVLFVCQPATGAVVLYRRLFTGLVKGLDGGGGVADRVFRLLLGNNRTGFVGNMSGLPGGVQLLPSRHFPAHNGQHWNEVLRNGTQHHDLYLNEVSPPGLNDVSFHQDPAVRADFRDRLEETADAHDWLGPPMLPSTIEGWQIAGNELDTDMSIGFDATGTPLPGRGAGGDDTVPWLSATALQFTDLTRTFLVPKLSHGTACLDTQVMSLTQQVLG